MVGGEEGEQAVVVLGAHRASWQVLPHAGYALVGAGVLLAGHP